MLRLVIIMVKPCLFLSWVVFKSGCLFLLWMLRRAVAVELEVPKGVSKLLYSVETAYLDIVREVVEYAVVNNVTSAINSRGCSTASIGGSTRVCMLT